ncbi:MAG: DUF1540 domain-containing protein [Thermoanaerobacteraceae bacterium]|nr:DUF1540 domain-containing protein [Thermoanaerobacteraceae bacterium]
MSLGIKCMVEECTYNKNNVCDAETIEVASSMGREVNDSDGTACKTFKARQ